MLALIFQLVAYLGPRALHCDGFFDGVTARGATTCVVRRDFGTENLSPYVETVAPLHLRCLPGETAWLPDPHRVECRRFTVDNVNATP